ncbi:MAG: ATP phosphoribosyltransferase [Synergistaceae bacterium]|nr:ATP phosphoribosyltransferase [Synergistaceae bacterium]
MLTIALPTGRSLDNCVKILETAGLPVEKLKDAKRNLVIEEGVYKYLLAKPTDVPYIVEWGGASLGIVGNDVTEESNARLVHIADTGLGKCVMAIAAPEESLERYEIAGNAKNLAGLRVATKYVHLAERTFKELGIQIKILKLNGSIELAPVQGIADCIFDVVQTGATLKANGLAVVKETLDVSLHVVARESAVEINEPLFAKTVMAIKNSL